MAAKRSKTMAVSARPARTKGASSSDRSLRAAVENGGHDGREKKSTRNVSWLFSKIAGATAHFAGHPATFLVALSIVVGWALIGPLFGYSDTWQLVINTATTIVTFLMVFLIQHTQNRDTLAVQLKLAELIMAIRGARNQVATIEHLSEEELEDLHEQYRQRAEETLDHLQRRRRRPMKPN